MARLFLAGCSVRAIAARFGMVQTAVRRLLEYEGVLRRERLANSDLQRPADHTQHLGGGDDLS